MPVRDASGKVRGTIEGPDFVVTRHRARHYLKAFGGWGLNCGVWETVKRAQEVLYIVVKEPDTGATYSVRKDDLIAMEESGELYTIAYEDRQIVMKEKFFDKRESPQGRLF